MLDRIISLASGVSLDIPNTWKQLIIEQRTIYGETREEWKLTWRERMLTNPPALISVYDFEWLSVDELEDSFLNWLSPTHQTVELFPFGQTGAGDTYCLAHKESKAFIALCWHDSGEGERVASSFDEFVYMKLIETLSDFSHLISKNFSKENSIQCVLADLERMIAVLPDPYKAGLITCKNNIHENLTIDACRLITPETKDNAFSLLDQHDQSQTFPLKNRWETG